ncbi:hypothetical protein TDB9533_02906 [Thalassocella blandensis]|nr:hypothetical protein TDB9533_02906 [Thalassocella blandensis]
MSFIKKSSCRLCVFWVLSLLTKTALAGTPDFNVSFFPTTIAPGASSTLTYRIDNSTNTVGVSAISFSNTLPAGVFIQNPSRAVTDCKNGIFSAAAGASSISFSGYRMAKGEICTLTLDVTSKTGGSHINTTSALTSSEGSSGDASATLTVDTSRPGFSAQFTPNTVNEGAVSRLVYTIDNSLNGSNVQYLTFADMLPTGLVVADDSGLQTDCNIAIAPGISAEPGGSSFLMQYVSVNAGDTCTVEYNVVAANAGIYSHVSGTLSQNGVSPSGTASAQLTVIKPFLNAQFPGLVSPGQSVNLTFTLHNLDRRYAATDISFSNDLNATLSGLTATDLPSTGFCGPGSTISGSSLLSIENASLAAEASCSFSVTVLVPSNAVAGTYTNSTSVIDLTLGSSTTKPAVSNILNIKKSPQLSWSFLDSPAATGSVITARFTLVNSDLANPVSQIDFILPLNTVYTGMTIFALPGANSCGSGSSFSQINDNDGLRFMVYNANLAAGASCEFDLLLQLPATGLAGSFEFSTGYISGVIAGSSVAGPPVSSSLTVITAPTLSVDIVENSVVPGGTVTTNFTLNYSENATENSTGVGFSMDLDAALSGLTAIDLPLGDVCGAASTLTGSSTLVFSGGTLQPGESCSFSATLQIPPGADPATVTVTSSNVSAVSSSESVISAAVSDGFIVSGLSFSKSFLPNPVLPGTSTILRFTISNDAASPAATQIAFTDYLSSIISGMQANSLPSTPCNGSSSISGTTVVSLTGGELLPGETCTFDVGVAVPVSANEGSYTSVTTALTATVNAAGTTSSAAYSALVVESLNAVISSAASNPTALSPIPVTIHFNRPVVNFVVSDLLITNGSASNFTGAGAQYTVDVTPNAEGEVTVSLPANSVDDAENTSFKNPVTTQFVIQHAVEPESLVVTVPGVAMNSTGESFVISGTHTVNASKVYLYADDDNNGVADNTTVLGSTIVDANSWSLTATLALQSANNFVLVWEDRAYRVNRTVDVPTITEITPDYDPVINGSPALSVNEDSVYSFTPTASDANTNQTISFSINNKPSWASFNTVTGALTGTPENADVGTANGIVITVTDSSNASASLPAFNITVINTNDAPVISGPPGTTVDQGSLYSFIPVVTEVDAGDSSTFSITNKPSWASFNTSTGELSGTPSNDDVGSTTGIVISVTDSASAADSLAAFNLTVSNINDAPVISGTPNATVNEDTLYSFTPLVTDVDSGDSQTFSITNKPVWASFNTATGVLSGTPANEDVGVSSGIVITVSDSSSATDSLAEFSIEVINVNDAPEISGTPNTKVVQDNAYAFTPAASDVDVGDTRTFSIINKPSWASFDTTTGALTGTPGNENVGVTSGIVITLTDSANASVDLPAFDLTVTNTNDAPVISGTPASSVNEDALYSFTPTATDVDLDETTTFSIVNKPSWANFDTATGTLSGSPENDDVGVTNGVVISVMDSAGATDSLPAFNLTVVNTNDAPTDITLTGGTVSQSSGVNAVVGSLTTADVDADSSFVYSLVAGMGDEDNASFNISGNQLRVNDASTMNAGTYTVRLQTDDGSAALAKAFQLTIVDDVIATVTGVLVPANATYILAGELDFTVMFSEVVEVDTSAGLPVLALTIGNNQRMASYHAGSGTSMLQFRYTVSADDMDVDGIALAESIQLNGSRILDTANFEVETLLTGVGNLTQVLVDGIAPLLNEITAVSSPGNNLKPSVLIRTDQAGTVNVSGSCGTDSETNIVDVGDISLRLTQTDNTSGLTEGLYDDCAITVTDVNGNISETLVLSEFIVDTTVPLVLLTENLQVNEGESAVIATRQVLAVDDISTQAANLTYTLTRLPDDGVLALGVINLAENDTFTQQDINDNRLLYTHNGNENSSDSFAFYVQDEAGNTAQAGVEDYVATVDITASNDAPTIDEGETVAIDISEDNSPIAFSLELHATDVDLPGDTLVWRVINAASYGVSNVISVGASTVVSYVPAENYNGADSFTVEVSDGEFTDSLVVTVNIAAVEDAPTITGSPTNIIPAGATYHFTPTAADADIGDVLTFSAAGLPAWASLNASTGTISGTPVNGDIGMNTITLSVSDGKTQTSLPAFSLEVVSAIDTDGDTIPDYQEEIEGTDPNNAEDYRDVTPPVVTAPETVTLNASALYTPVTAKTLLGLQANASLARILKAKSALSEDNVDGEQCCEAMLVNASKDTLLLPPGRNEVTWRAIDAKGNIGEAIQVVDIRPLVSLSPDRISAEGATVNMRILLNGESPEYPLDIPFVIDENTTATRQDHDLIEGFVRLTEGQTEASVAIALTRDNVDESDEQLIVHLDTDTVNAGVKSSYTLTITEANVAPELSILLEQNGNPTVIVSPTAGNVTVTAIVDDANSGDTHSFDWSASDTTLIDQDGNLTDMGMVFDPSDLTTGVAIVKVTVSDNHGASDTVKLAFRVESDLPVLDVNTDRDNDGENDFSEGVGDIDDDGIPNYLDNLTAGNVLPESVDSASSFLIECEPGLRCRLGEYSLAGVLGGAHLLYSEDMLRMNIPSDENFEHIGGVFDFEIVDLPIAGQSTSIVIPQITVIPMHAVYRKFSHGQWKTFVEDANNSLHSARGNAGYCPPPGDSSWRPGLIAGNYCVQLTIEDGGPNDADGEANGSIEDPGVVAQPIIEDGVEVSDIRSTGGGGASSGGILLLLSFIVFSARFRKKIRHYTASILNVVLVCGMFVASQTSQAQDVQVRLGVAQALGTEGRGGMRSAVDDHVESLNLYRYDDSRWAYRLSLEIDLGLEGALAGSGISLSYIDLGEVGVNLDAQITNEIGFAKAIEETYPVTGDGVAISYLYVYELSKKFTGVFELGMFYWDGDINMSGSNLPKNYNDGFDPFFGGHALYALNDQWSVGVDLMHYLLDDQSVTSLGASIGFSLD